MTQIATYLANGFKSISLADLDISELNVPQTRDHS